MEKDVNRLRQLQAEGMGCAQIFVRLGLELLGEQNERMVRAASGLCGGVQCGLLCGSLTGAATMLSLFDETLAAEEMIPKLARWFQGHGEEAFGGTDCNHILEGSMENFTLRCTGLIEEVYRKAREILEEFG